MTRQLEEESSDSEQEEDEGKARQGRAERRGDRNNNRTGHGRVNSVKSINSLTTRVRSTLNQPLKVKER